MDYQVLKEKAREASKNSYSPYSHFKVGACLLLKNNVYIQGCNIENASYGLANCAERTAMFTAYAQGYKKDDILAIAVYSPLEKLVPPCGACCQVMNELLNKDTPVLMVYGKNLNTKEVTVKDLLPYSFSGENLNV